MGCSQAAVPRSLAQLGKHNMSSRHATSPCQAKIGLLVQQLVSVVCSIFSPRPHAGESERSPGSVRHVPATCVCAPARHLDIWRWGVGEDSASDSTFGSLARPEDVALFTGVAATVDNTANCPVFEQCPQHLINRAWSALLDPTDHTDDRQIRGLAGAAMFLLLGIMAQWITNEFCPLAQLPSKLNVTELVTITALGYVLEGQLNPWWQRSVEARLAATGFRPAVSGAVRILLDICIFTPMCCELYLVSEHVVVEGHWRDYYINVAVMLYQLFDLRIVDAATIEAALEQPLDITSELLDEVSSSGAWDAVRAVFARALPPPLRPLVRRLAEATGWTVLETVSL